MNGRPVWLASVSLRNPGTILTGEYNDKQRKRALRHLRGMLRGVGDPQWERLFRMNLTLCLHRALSEHERARLPASWSNTPAYDIAGGPIEVIYSRGVEPLWISADPCHSPKQHYISRRVWAPIDCGECPPCLARAEIMRTGKPCGEVCGIGKGNN